MPSRARRDPAAILKIARFTADALRLGREIRDDDVILDDRYHAGIYGIPDESTLPATRLSAGFEAMMADPVYEGEVDGRDDRHFLAWRDRAVMEHALCPPRGQPAQHGYASWFG